MSLTRFHISNATHLDCGESGDDFLASRCLAVFLLLLVSNKFVPFWVTGIQVSVRIFLS